MNEFKKGQLVAVRYGPSWEPRIFRRKDDDGLWCMDFLSHGASPYAQEDVEPAEDVWPEIFLGWEHRAREQSDHAVEMESKLVQRLRRQIEWLCQELGHADMCPSVSAIASCDNDCPSCWKQASLKAVKEEQC